MRFLPYLRPLVGVGVVDAVIDWSKLGKGDLVPAQEHDAFDEEIKDILVGSDDDAKTAGVRGALFLKGKIKGETLLTLRYDSEEDRYETLFRDIEPDRFYPVYGDSSTRGFDAQSTSRLYVRLDRGPSYVFYGDFVTRGVRRHRRPRRLPARPHRRARSLREELDRARRVRQPRRQHADRRGDPRPRHRRSLRPAPGRSAREQRAGRDPGARPRPAEPGARAALADALRRLRDRLRSPARCCCASRCRPSTRT